MIDDSLVFFEQYKGGANSILTGQSEWRCPSY